MFGNIELPTVDSPPYRPEEYPYIARSPADAHDARAIQKLLADLRDNSKVHLESQNDWELHLDRLARHEVEHRLGQEYDHKASYYDASGLPVRIFYRGQPKPQDSNIIYINTPLKVFGRRDAFRKDQNLEEEKSKNWKRWETAQANPIYGFTQHLPTHVVFPQCLPLQSSPPPTTTKRGQSKSDEMELWLRDSSFRLEFEYYIDLQKYTEVWTQEKIDVAPDDPLYTTERNHVFKARVSPDDRRDGSPSSPFVALLRHDMFRNGDKVGHTAFFFLRIEKVGDRYVPWRGPPRRPSTRPPPPPAAATASSSSTTIHPRLRDLSDSPSSRFLSLRKRAIYRK